MSATEVYLAAMCVLSLVLSVAGLVQSHRIQSRAMDLLLESGDMELKVATVLSQHGDSIRELAQIAVRQEQRLADQETKIMGLMKRGEK